jgi:hypothetical protein
MHIRFGDGDDEQAPVPAAAPQHVAPHAAFAGPGFQCVSSVRVDFDNKDQCYVFQLTHNGQGLVAASLSNKRIKLFRFRCGSHAIWRWPDTAPWPCIAAAALLPPLPVVT